MEQTEGVDFSIEDKNKIAKVLSEIGIDYMRVVGQAQSCGHKFFSIHQIYKHFIYSFGMTKKAGRSADNDPDWHL